MPCHRHWWDFENAVELGEALAKRDAAFRRARLGAVISSQGVEAATILHDEVMANNPVPSPSPRIVCQLCGVLQPLRGAS